MCLGCFRPVTGTAGCTMWDIRSKGSGNSGTTNVLRVMGVKAGILVFLGDFFKTVIPCVIVRIIWKDEPGLQHLLVLYTALGVILGHNFPFYMGFKGGKGIAATAGLLAAMDLRVAVVCLLAFVLIVAVTRYVSLGSLVVVDHLPGRHDLVFLPGRVWADSRQPAGILRRIGSGDRHGVLEAQKQHRPSAARHGKQAGQQKIDRRIPWQEQELSEPAPGDAPWRCLLHDNGHTVTVWSALPDEARQLQADHEHKNLPGVHLRKRLFLRTLWRRP